MYLSIALPWCCKYFTHKDKDEQSDDMCCSVRISAKHKLVQHGQSSESITHHIVPRCIAINNIIPSRWTMYVPFRLPLMPALVVDLRPLNKPRNAEKNLDQKIEGHDEY